MTEELEFEFEDRIKGIRLRFKGDKSSIEEFYKKWNSIFEEAKQRKWQTSEQILPPISLPVKPEPSVTHPTAEITKETLPLLPRKPTSFTEYLTTLMGTEWGAKGRTSDEIYEASKQHLIPLDKRTLFSILSYLIKQRRLRREKDLSVDRWRYYPTLATEK